MILLGPYPNSIGYYSTDVNLNNVAVSESVAQNSTADFLSDIASMLVPNNGLINPIPASDSSEISESNNTITSTENYTSENSTYPELTQQLTTQAISSISATQKINLIIQNIQFESDYWLNGFQFKTNESNGSITIEVTEK